MRKALFLGHVVTPEGVRPNPEKVETVKNYPVPKDHKALQRFLGLTGYFRHFVRNYGIISKPLTAISASKEKFKWGTEQQVAFETLRDKLTSDEVLIHPDFNKQFFVECDASGNEVGAILCQMDEKAKALRPVAYSSMGFSPEMKIRNRSATEKELYAVCCAVKKV